MREDEKRVPYTMRMDPELSRKFEKTKKKHGLGTTEMMELILKFYLSCNPFVWETLGGFARQSGLPLSRLAEGFILNELSREEAYNTVHGEPSPTFILPFQGENLFKQGEELATALTKHWEEIFRVVKETIEENPGLPISQMAEKVKAFELFVH